MPPRKTIQQRAADAAAKLRIESQIPQNLHKGAGQPGDSLDDQLEEGLGGGDEAPASDPLSDAAAAESDTSAQKEIEKLRKENQELREQQGKEVPSEAWQAKQELQAAQAQVAALQQRLDNSPAHQQEIAQWQGKDVRILLPWWKMTNPMTALSVSAFALQYGREKLGIIPHFGDSMIYNLRNHLADKFLESGAQWSFWLDDDVIAPFGAPSLFRQFTGLTEAEFPDHLLAVNAIEQLKSHPNAKVIGGVYFGRRRLSPPMFGRGMEDIQAYQASKQGRKGLIETDWIATGCLMVHRDVYLDIRKKFPSLCPKGEREVNMWGFVYTDPADNVELFVTSADDVPEGALNVRSERRMVKLPPIPSWQYFAPAPGRGEDVMFCARARRAGHKVYADPSVACLHVGAMAYGLHNVTYPKFESVPTAIRGLPEGATFPGQMQNAAAMPQVPQGPAGTLTPQETGIPGMPRLPGRMGG